MRSASAVPAATAAVSTAPLSCGVCQQVFRSKLHLGRHYQCSGHGPVAPVVKEVKHRHSYSFRRKRDLLFELDGLAGDVKLLSTESRTGISQKTIYAWNNQRDSIFRFARTKGMSKLRKFRPTAAHHQEAIVRLYTQFVWRRMVQRLRTSRKWLKSTMLSITESDYGASEFKASDGWVANFCCRWKITHQRKSNVKKLSLAERLPEIRKFHRWLIYGLQCSEPQRCTKYGRFDPTRIVPHGPGPFAILLISQDESELTWRARRVKSKRQEGAVQPSAFAQSKCGSALTHDRGRI